MEYTAFQGSSLNERYNFVFANTMRQIRALPHCLSHKKSFNENSVRKQR